MTVRPAASAFYLEDIRVQKVNEVYRSFENRFIVYCLLERWIDRQLSVIEKVRFQPSF